MLTLWAAWSAVAMLIGEDSAVIIIVTLIIYIVLQRVQKALHKSYPICFIDAALGLLLLYEFLL